MTIIIISVLFIAAAVCVVLYYQAAMRRTSKIQHITSAIYSALFSVLEEMGLFPPGDMHFISMKFAFGGSMTEEQIFDRIKKEISENSVEIVVNGRKTDLPLCKIVGELKFDDDLKAALRKKIEAFVNGLGRQG